MAYTRKFEINGTVVGTQTGDETLIRIDGIKINGSITEKVEFFDMSEQEYIRFYTGDVFEMKTLVSIKEQTRYASEKTEIVLSL